MASAFQNTRTFNHFIINYGRICFLKLNNEVSLLPTKYFFRHIWTQNNFFAMKIAKHCQKTGIEIDFFTLCFVHHHIQIMRLEFLLLPPPSLVCFLPLEWEKFLHYGQSLETRPSVGTTKR